MCTVCLTTGMRDNSEMVRAGWLWLVCPVGDGSSSGWVSQVQTRGRGSGGREGEDAVVSAKGQRRETGPCPPTSPRLRITSEYPMVLPRKEWRESKGVQGTCRR